jgi:hypothetical protein
MKKALAFTLLTASVLTGCATTPVMMAAPVPMGQAGAQAIKTRNMSMTKAGADPKRNKPAAPALQVRLLEATPSRSLYTEDDARSIARMALFRMEQALHYTSGNTTGYDALKLIIAKLGKNNLFARVGYAGANNFISSENAFKVLVVTLDHVANDRPMTGPASFAAYRAMMEQTTNWQDGSKVGYEILGLLRTDYPDASIRQLADTAFGQARQAGGWEPAFKLILSAFDEMKARS